MKIVYRRAERKHNLCDALDSYMYDEQLRITGGFARIPLRTVQQPM